MDRVAPRGHGLKELVLFAVLVEAESDISLAAPSTCRGNPCDGSGSCSGSGCIDGSGSSSSSSSSTDSFFSSSLDSPDTGGGAAGSDPQSAGERERA